MADYTPHQRKIIRRYYENAEAIGYQRIAELVSEIYLADSKQLDRLWRQVATALQKIKLPESRVAHILDRRDPKVLAELIKELSSRSR